uniref:Small ribosomal subunit protein uS2c n=1 Tax=Borodinellopsis insignis TaxID=3229915 RepID=A0AB39U3S7_9CHLO
MAYKTTSEAPPIRGSHTIIGKKKIVAGNCNVGDICVLKITALGPNNVGIDEFSYAYPILVSNVNLGDTIKAKIIKNGKFNGVPRSLPPQSWYPYKNYGVPPYMTSDSSPSASSPSEAPPSASSPSEATPKSPPIRGLGSPMFGGPHRGGGHALYREGNLLKKYAIAKKVEVVLPNTMSGVPQKLAETSILNSGDILDVTIDKLSLKGAGVVEISESYKLIIPNANVGEKVKVCVTITKPHYAFAKILEKNVAGDFLLKDREKKNNKKKNFSYDNGSKLTITLPNNIEKTFGKYSIFKIHDQRSSHYNNIVPQVPHKTLGDFVIFLKLGLGAKAGDTIRIKLTKVSTNYAIAKVIKVNLLKRGLTQNLGYKRTLLSIHQMVKNGMHFGEKAVKTDARMKKYVWQKKQGNMYRPLIKKGIYIINLLKTRRCLNKALNLLSKYAVKGRTFLFIGTKKPAAGLIAIASLFSKTSFFVNTRWLGGMLTNWKTIYKSISKIRPILKEKQKIYIDILEKRQNIKNILIQKALLLRKKGTLILTKGRQYKELLAQSIKPNNITESPYAKNLLFKRKQLIEKSQILLLKRQTLLEKRRILMLQSQILKNKGRETVINYETLLRQLTLHNKKLIELKSFYTLSLEIKNLKKLAKQQNKDVYSMSYTNLLNYVYKESSNNSLDLLEDKKNSIYKGILPNPPKEILNRIVVTMLNFTKHNGVPYKVPQYNSEKNSSILNVLSTKSTNIENFGYILLSKLLTKFSLFAPYLKTLIKNVKKHISNLENICRNVFSLLINIQKLLTNYVQIKNQISSELLFIKQKLSTERNVIVVLKTKLQFFLSQKKLFKFLPKLRYLPTGRNKIAQTVQILMRKIVDPKLKYPIDNIYNNIQQRISISKDKKLAAIRKKKWQRLEKYFGGIANMTKMNNTKISKNIAIIIGQKEELNAVKECKKLGIKMFNIVDTNCNPSLADHIIPANDDSRNAIKYILNKFLIRIKLAQKLSLRYKR